MTWSTSPKKGVIMEHSHHYTDSIRKTAKEVLTSVPLPYLKNWWESNYLWSYGIRIWNRDEISAKCKQYVRNTGEKTIRANTDSSFTDGCPSFPPNKWQMANSTIFTNHTSPKWLPKKYVTGALSGSAQPMKWMEAGLRITEIPQTMSRLGDVCITLQNSWVSLPTMSSYGHPTV